MIIISSYNFKLMLITLAINGLAQMQHTNDEISIVTCKGNDVDMLWNVDEEESNISQLQLYFNNTIICYTSDVNGFLVSTSYQGRIERIGKTSFRLKNVSLDDEGYYTMLALIAWSTNYKMKQMVLRILEPPTEKCTCNIQPDFKCELPKSDCGRPTVSLVWKRKKTYEDLGGGNWTMNFTLQDEEILSCLDGEAMKCVNDSSQFCTNVSIPHQVTEKSHEDRNTQQTDSVAVPGFRGTDNDSTAFNKFRDLHIGSLVGTLIIIIVIVSVSSGILYYGGKKFLKKSEHKAYHEDASPDTDETVPMNDTEIEIKLETLQQTTLIPSIDTEEAISMNDLIIEKEFQNLQNVVLHIRSFVSQVTEELITWTQSESAEFIPMNQPMNNLDTEGDLQKLQQPTLHPIFDTGEAICMKDSNVANEFQRLQKATCQMMHLLIQIYEEYMTYKMPGKAEIFKEYRNCIQ